DPVRTAFTYQGLLYDANRVADDQYDFQFKLFGSLAGSKVDGDVNVPDVDVFDGYFTVELDFGDVYDGNERWLEIGVRPGEMNDPNYYTVLEPRQELTATPYALYSKSAGSDNDWMVSGNDMYSIPTGNVGVGVSNPSEQLEVDGMISAFRTGTSGIIQVNDKRLSGGGWNLYSGALTEGDFSINEDAALNVPRLYIKAGGNVGIGTESPSEKLNVVGDANITGNLYASSGVQGDSSSSDGVIGWTDANDKSGVYGYSSEGTGVTGRSEAASGRGIFGKNVPTGNYGILGDPNYGVYGESNSGTAAYFTSTLGNGLIVADGNVGIGTTSPTEQLHVYDAGASCIVRVETASSSDSAALDLRNGLGYSELEMDGSRLELINWAAGPMVFFTGTTPGYATNRILISNTGNVGIGPLGPTALLDVSGPTGYNQFRMRVSYTPTGTADPNGSVGDLAWDDSYIYIKTSGGWKRAQLQTF
ncbi:MAG: hypothetical protein ACYS21_17945, partial [Planctomycetota bacterium]